MYILKATYVFDHCRADPVHYMAIPRAPYIIRYERNMNFQLEQSSVPKEV